jgi:hypothetical protein
VISSQMTPGSLTRRNILIFNTFLSEGERSRSFDLIMVVPHHC